MLILIFILSKIYFLVLLYQPAFIRLIITTRWEGSFVGITVDFQVCNMRCTKIKIVVVRSRAF